MKPCHHHFLQIEGFHALGQTVSCVICGVTFELSDAAGAADYFPFTFIVPGRGEMEVNFFIHHSRVRLPDGKRGRSS